MIKGIVTDVDGTLLDTDTLHEFAWRKTLADSGLGMLTHDEYLVHFSGVGKSESHNYLASRVASWQSFEEDSQPITSVAEIDSTANVIATLASQLYARVATHNVKAFDDVLGLLLQARHMGLKLGYASASVNAENSLRSLRLEACLSPSDLTAYNLRPDSSLHDLFDAGLGGKANIPQKPKPDIYLKVSSLMGIKPEEMLVLEDSASGVESALASGAFCVGINRNGSLPAIKARNPHVVYDATARNNSNPLNLVYLVKTASG